MVISVLVGQQLQAVPITLNFDSAYHADSGATYRGAYQEQAYNITSSKVTDYAYGNFGSASANFAGSSAFYNNYGYSKNALTRADGDLFNIYSVDISELLKTGQSTTVSFTGYFNGGASITQNFILDGIFGFQTFLFSGFNELKTLEWTTGGTSGSLMTQFDNLKVEASSSAAASLAAVTVPDGGATLTLLGLGFVGIVALKRKTKE